MRRAIAPPPYINQSLTSPGVNPTWGMIMLIVAQSYDMIYALQTVDSCLPLKTEAMCVLLWASSCRRCTIRRPMTATAHAWGGLLIHVRWNLPLRYFFHCKEEADEGCGGIDGRGICGGWAWRGNHKELDVS